MLRHPCILGGPQQRVPNQKTKPTTSVVTMMHHATKHGFKDCPGFLNGRKVGAQKRAEMLRHPCILGGPQQRGQNQKSKSTTPGVTMMHHATKHGFKDCPGFLNSTGRLGPKRGRKCYVTPAFSGVPNKGDKIRSQNLR